MAKAWIDFHYSEYDRLWKKAQEELWWTFVPLYQGIPVGNKLISLHNRRKELYKLIINFKLA